MERLRILRQSKHMMVALAFIVAASFFVSVTSVPVHKRKSDLEKLKSILGPDFEEFSKLDGELKLQFAKEMVRAKPEEREKVYRHWREIMKQHVPAHSPGSVEQLHETWRADDHMTDDSYSAKSLFRTHDFNNDGFLSGPEIHSLYYSQLDRVYPDHDNAEDILRQREDIRMYANYLNMMDRNKDGKISLEEFETFQPPHDEQYDWMDEDDLPDPEHLGDDPSLVDALQKDLKLHPNDTLSEELMHRVVGKPAIHEKPISAGYQFPHENEHQPPKHDAPHPASPIPAQNPPHPASPAAAVPDKEPPQAHT